MITVSRPAKNALIFMLIVCLSVPEFLPARVQRLLRGAALHRGHLLPHLWSRSLLQGRLRLH